MKSLRLCIFGRVQGVFFRKYTKDIAIKAGLSGTVRNCPDGNVEIFVEGDETSLHDFVEWCHHGPSGAKVEKVDIHETRLKNFSGFEILRS